MPTKSIVTVNYAIENVFTFISDHRNDPLWKPFVVEGKQLSIGPIEAGTLFEVSSVVGNRRFSSIIEVIEYKPYSRYTYKSHAPPFPFVASLDFETNGHSTIISGDVRFEARGILAWLSPLLRGIVSRQSKRTFAGIEQAMRHRLK